MRLTAARRLVLPALAIALLGAAPAGPAPALSSGAAVRAPLARAASGPVRARIIFDKDRRHPFDSRILWRAWRRQAGGAWALVDRGSWRAGSGFGGPSTTKECVRNRGWLPNGRYSFVQYDDYHGSVIHGRVFFLGSHRCRNGTVRSELFIHTETGGRNVQCADARGDQACRWEWPKINDYRSAGCIKMAPRDLLALTRHYHRWFDPRVRYRMSRVRVVVRP